MDGKCPVELEAVFSKMTLPSDRMVELAVSLVFKNRMAEPADIYPGAAQPSWVGGWGGPSYDVRIDGAVRKQLRTWYGPPGHPPGEKYYREKMTILGAGKTCRWKVTACWIPRSLLSDAHLAVRTLDPEGMDSLDERTIAQSSVLVLNRTVGDVAKEMKGRLDFLRPGELIFFPERGGYECTVSYHQSEWTGFAPKSRFSAIAPPVRILVI